MSEQGNQRSEKRGHPNILKKRRKNRGSFNQEVNLEFKFDSEICEYFGRGLFIYSYIYSFF